MAEVALNLVALVVGGVIALWCLLALQFLGYEATCRLAWHRRGLFLESSLRGWLWDSSLRALIWLGPPALLVSVLHYFSPGVLPWVLPRWGFWSGFAVAAVLALLVLVGTTREERRADFYRDNREKLKTRLVIRQQSYLKPFREAWEAAEKKAQPDQEQAQAAPAEASEDALAHLDFEILDVDRRQQIGDAPPYASDGGDWTVCTCRILVGSRAAFYFAERSGEPAPAVRFAWGEAKLWVPTARDGADLAEAIGDAFRVTQGRGRATGSAPARVLSFGTAVLSRGTAAQPDGSFAGTGSWTASKWFYEEAIELYVNWSLDERRGRFAEKDEDFAPGVYAAFRTLVG
jgi:hypothetical protein